MPATVKLPPGSNVTLEAASARYYFETCRTHIYLVLGAAVILIVVRLIVAHSRDSQLVYPWTRILRHKQQETAITRESKDPLLLDSKQNPSHRPLGTNHSAPARGCLCSPPDQERSEFSSSNPQDKSDSTAGLPSRGVQTGPIGISWHLLAMDGDVSDQRKDHTGSAPARSRGVSTNTSNAPGIRRQLDPSLVGGIRSGPSEERRRSSSRSSRSFVSQSSSQRRQSGSSNGADSQRTKGKGEGKGKEPMTSQGDWSRGVRRTSAEDNLELTRSSGDLSWPGSTQGASYVDVNYTMPSWQFSRPPPPAPLTPPTLDDAVFPFENRRLGYAASIPPELEGGFIYQETSDYGSSSTSADILSSSPYSTTGIPQRRSYNQSVPIGIPMPTTPAISASSSTETIPSTTTFSPSSFPPRNPLLPPPPPGSGLPYGYQFVGGPGGPGIVESTEIVDIHGEILSVTDDHMDHSWTRHTRVYGGGVCLACLAADGEGGFYGDKVPLEDRR